MNHVPIYQSIEISMEHNVEQFHVEEMDSEILDNHHKTEDEMEVEPV